MKFIYIFASLFLVGCSTSTLELKDYGAAPKSNLAVSDNRADKSYVVKVLSSDGQPTKKIATNINLDEWFSKAISSKLDSIGVDTEKNFKYIAVFIDKAELSFSKFRTKNLITDGSVRIMIKKKDRIIKRKISHSKRECSSFSDLDTLKANVDELLLYLVDESAKEIKESL